MSAPHKTTHRRIRMQAIPLAQILSLSKSLRANSLLACCWLALILFQYSLNFNGDNSHFVHAQTTITDRNGIIRLLERTNPTTTTQFVPTTLQSARIPKNPQQQTTTTSTTTITNSNQQQPKTLKFTIVAGKYWKFNIKANTFTSHKEGELRLHKNISFNNYIIDDDAWFQYNPIQQQLFAWPSLFVKPGSYQFVLLPSGLDFEADGESVVKEPDVAANIIVELIKPVYTKNINDIDQLIDFKFSLDFLHRHSNYPLLVNQVIAVFEALSSSSTGKNKQSPNDITQTNPNSTITNTISLLDKLKGVQRSTNKLVEFLLINQSYSSDGEFFSITWTTQASLVNNTITQTNECRLSIISDVVSKLSNLSDGYSSPDDKYTLYYPIDTNSNINSQALLTTERGNHSLRLNLNDPCQREKVLDELGIATSPLEIKSSIAAISNILVVDNHDKDNKVTIIPTLQSVVTTSGNNSNNILNTDDSFSTMPTSDAIDLDTAPSSGPKLLRAAFNNDSSIVNTTPAIENVFLPFSSNSTINNTQASNLETSTTVWTTETTTSSHPKPVSISVLDVNAPTINELPSEKVNTSTLDTQNQPKTPNSIFESDSTISTTPVVVVDSKNQIDDIQPTSEQPKLLSQTNSSINLIEANDSPSLTQSNITNEEPVISSDSQHLPSTVTTTIPINMPNSTKLTIPNDSQSNNEPLVVPTTETGLNEDFIGILNNVMDYLVSIAVPASLIIGSILVVSIIVALCHLCIKRRKSKQFQVKNRFKFRYGSERRGFLKNSSKPVILEADRKSLSCGGPTTPAKDYNQDNNSKNDKRSGLTFLQMKPINSGTNFTTYTTGPTQQS